MTRSCSKRNNIDRNNANVNKLTSHVQLLSKKNKKKQKKTKQNKTRQNKTKVPEILRAHRNHHNHQATSIRTPNPNLEMNHNSFYLYIPIHKQPAFPPLLQT